MPSHCYRQRWELSSSSSSAAAASLEILFIDTALIAPSITPQTAKNVTTMEVNAYLQLVERELAASNATWLIVAGHYTGKCYTFYYVQYMCCIYYQWDM